MAQNPGVEREERSANVVAFVSVGRGLGGPSRSLLTLLQHLQGEIVRVVLAPNGPLTDLFIHSDAADEFVRLPNWRRWSRLSRLLAGIRICLWIIRNRNRVRAFHANGYAALNLVAPSAFLFGIPVVTWAHASEASPSATLLGRLWKRLLPQLRWAVVSSEAHQVLVGAHLVTRNSQVSVIPNPIDPASVVSRQTVPHDRLTIGYLKGKGTSSGFHLLADAIKGLSDLSVRWLIFTNPPDQTASDDQKRRWAELGAISGTDVELRGTIPDVTHAYAECDIVFCPSFQESFGRVAAEAMLNGIPVVASDIPALRRLLGDDQAGLLFPVGEVDHAIQQLRRLVENGDLRQALGEEGRKRAEAFAPKAIKEQLLALYGFRKTCSVATSLE